MRRSLQLTLPKDTRSTPGDLAKAFEQFCERLLQAEGFETEASPTYKGPGGRVVRPDIMARKPGNRQAIVEVKFYRSKRIDPSLIPNAIRQINYYRDALKSPREGSPDGILIVTSRVSDDLKTKAGKTGIAIWDYDDLVMRSSKHANLLPDFTQLLHDGTANIFGSDDYDRIRNVEEVGRLKADLSEEAGLGEGAKIANELSKIRSGSEASRPFEDACERAVKYLFAEEFQRWSSQHQVEEGFHRLDLIARLVPKHEFWVSLSQDFATRYVVFEFKNFEEPIGQNQIYLTEKYLFSGGLRRVSVVVARKGLDSGGQRATKACLRDNGKLIICLSLCDLRQMLLAKDTGDEYNELMIIRVSDLMMGLAP